MNTNLHDPKLSVTLMNYLDVNIVPNLYLVSKYIFYEIFGYLSQKCIEIKSNILQAVSICSSVQFLCH